MYCEINLKKDINDIAGKWLKEEVLNILDNYENMINEKEYNKDPSNTNFLSLT